MSLCRSLFLLGRALRGRVTVFGGSRAEFSRRGAASDLPEVSNAGRQSEDVDGLGGVGDAKPKVCDREGRTGAQVQVQVLHVVALVGGFLSPWEPHSLRKGGAHKR